MRLMVYNIRYGTGGRHFLFPWSGYLRKTAANLDRITEFIGAQQPDIVGLLEVDEGSYRSRGKNQAEEIAQTLGHYHTCRLKYSQSSMLARLPLLGKQGNAFLTNDTIEQTKFHYCARGVKRLVIELELENLTLFLVHLSLNFRVRHDQLRDIYNLVKNTKKPHIVAGDFNAFWGEREIELFLAATRLTNANPSNMPSFPSWEPRRHLDFILHSPQIRVSKFQIPQVIYSDHLPLILDFEPG